MILLTQDSTKQIIFILCLCIRSLILFKVFTPKAPLQFQHIILIWFIINNEKKEQNANRRRLNRIEEQGKNHGSGGGLPPLSTSNLPFFWDIEPSESPLRAKASFLILSWYWPKVSKLTNPPSLFLPQKSLSHPSLDQIYPQFPQP